MSGDEPGLTSAEAMDVVNLTDEEFDAKYPPDTAGLLVVTWEDFEDVT